MALEHIWWKAFPSQLPWFKPCSTSAPPLPYGRIIHLAVSVQPTKITELAEWFTVILTRLLYLVFKRWVWTYCMLSCCGFPGGRRIFAYFTVHAWTGIRVGTRWFVTVAVVIYAIKRTVQWALTKYSTKSCRISFVMSYKSDGNDKIFTRTNILICLFVEILALSSQIRWSRRP